MMLKRAFIIVLCSLFFCNSFAKAYVVDPNGAEGRFVGHFVFDTLPLNLDALAETADRVFVGTCTGIKDIKKDKLAKVHVVKYTFKISEAIKGVTGKTEISFKQWKATTREAGYTIGEKYVLFLYPNSRLGLTSPVGFLQGQFNINTDSISHREFVINKLANKGLYKNLKGQSADEHHHIHPGEGTSEATLIERDEFVKNIRAIVKSQEGKK